MAQSTSEPAVVPNTQHSSVFAADSDPVLVVDQDEIFTLQTHSHLTNDEFHRVTDLHQLRIPVTGPVSVRGVKAGQVLRVEVCDVRIGDAGTMVTLPGRGAFRRELQPFAKLLPIKDGFVEFDDIRLPVRTMVGKLGVGVPGEAPSSSTVGVHGGNMDCTDVAPHSVVFLPVLVDGAQLYAGDLHARQADGEVSVTAVEVEGEVDLKCRVVSGLDVKRPFILSGGKLIIVADGDTLDEAVADALDDLLELVVARRACSHEEAAMLLSIAADVGICQVVNPRVSVKVSLPVEFCDLGFG